MPQAERAERAGSKLAASDENSSSMSHPVLPTRIITYGWGEKYIDILVRITLPALLASGNLPHVAASVPCELIILTQDDVFSKLRRQPVVRNIEAFCPVRLIALDDLVSSPDQYGIALTHVLHRGFSDLGPAMTDAWLIFLNADFILADGSLKCLLRYLQAGERLVAAPSYCVNAEDVLPELQAGVDLHRQSLTLAPRAMADLILRNRHNTIRAKTVNQPTFGIRWMDQFYWLHDAQTLLGHQMPIAIVGMRPERHVAEPNSYWDHGLMREYCPIVQPCVIGDSDEFLMLELRDADVARDHLHPALADPVRIARDWAGFVTPYQRDMLRYPLVLHAQDLPAGLDASRRQLGEFVGRVLAQVPAKLPSHIGHPQWNYHWPRFTRSRHDFLSRRLGPAIEASNPPEYSSALDRLWWQLAGLEKAYERQKGEIEYLQACHCAAFQTALDHLDDTFVQRHTEMSSCLPALLAAEDINVEAGREEIVAEEKSSHVLCRAIEKPAKVHHSQMLQIEQNGQKLLELRRAIDGERQILLEGLKFVESHYRDQLARLAEEFETSHTPLRLDYERKLGREKTSSAVVPHVILRQGPQESAEPEPGRQLVRLARLAQHALFGRFPSVRRTSPYWAPMRHVRRIVDEARTAGAADVLTVIGDSSVPNTFANKLLGTHAEVQFEEAVQGNLSISLAPEVRFDLCVCDLAIAQLERFEQLARVVLPHIREGGKIIGFCPNFSLVPIDIENRKSLALLEDFPRTKIYYTGSSGSMRVLRWFNNPSAPMRSGKSLIFGAVKLIAVCPIVLLANCIEEWAVSMTRPPTSISIEISV